TVLAAAEAVGAQRDDRPADPARDHIRLALEIVARGDDDALRLREAGRHVRHARLLRRMQAVPPLDAAGVMVKLGVAGAAPAVRGRRGRTSRIALRPDAPR